MASSTSTEAMLHHTPPPPKPRDERTLRLLDIIACKNEGILGRFFSSRLPLELFLAIAKHAHWEDLIAMTQTCSAWRKELLAYPPLWDELHVDLGRLEGLDKAREVSKRAKQNGLKILRLDVDLQDEMALEEQPVCATLRCVLSEVSRHDGGRGITEIKLDLGAYQ